MLCFYGMLVQSCLDYQMGLSSSATCQFRDLLLTELQLAVDIFSRTAIESQYSELIRSIGLWQWFIKITILDIIYSPALYFRDRIQSRKRHVLKDDSQLWLLYSQLISPSLVGGNDCVCVSSATLNLLSFFVSSFSIVFYVTDLQNTWWDTDLITLTLSQNLPWRIKPSCSVSLDPTTSPYNAMTHSITIWTTYILFNFII